MAVVGVCREESVRKSGSIFTPLRSRKELEDAHIKIRLRIQLKPSQINCIIESYRRGAKIKFHLSRQQDILGLSMTFDSSWSNCSLHDNPRQYPKTLLLRKFFFCDVPAIPKFYAKNNCNQIWCNERKARK